MQVTDVLAVVGDLAAGDGRETEHGPTQGRLARPGLADQTDGLTRLDVDRDALERLERLGAEPLAGILDDEVVDGEQ